MEIIELFLVLSESLSSQDPMKKDKPHAYFHGERLNIKKKFHIIKIKKKKKK